MKSTLHALRRAMGIDGNMIVDLPYPSVIMRIGFIAEHESAVDAVDGSSTGT